MVKRWLTFSWGNCHHFEKKIFGKSPAGLNFVKNASIFNPHTFRNEEVAVVLCKGNWTSSLPIWKSKKSYQQHSVIISRMYYNLKVNIVKFENFSANDTNYGNLGLLGLRNTKSSRSKSFCLWWLNAILFIKLLTHSMSVILFV